MKKRFLGFVLGVSVCSVAGIMLAAESVADPVCQALLDAMSKSTRTPVHAYSTMGGLTNGTAPQQIETITIGDLAYTKIGAEWKASKARRLEAEFMEQMKLHPGAIRCKQEADEPFDGEAAAVYRMRLQEGNKIVDCKMWVSKARGLMIHTTIDIQLNGAVTNVSVRYDYNNVHVPAGATEAGKK